MKKLILITAILFGAAGLTFGQGAMIKGKVMDATNGGPLMFATVHVELGSGTMGTTTDEEGRFTIKPLEPGTYDVVVTMMGYQTTTIQGVLVNKDKITFMNDMQVAFKSNLLKEAVVVDYKVPLINPEDPSAMTMLAAEIQATPAAKNPKQAVAMMSSDIKINEQGQLYFRGARPETMGYYVDGVKMDDNLTGVPGQSIGSLTTYTGGIPAKYGDITGGVVVIETKSYFELYKQRQRVSR